MYDTEGGKLLISRDVEFLEEDFERSSFEITEVNDYKRLFNFDENEENDEQVQEIRWSTRHAINGVASIYATLAAKRKKF